MLRTLIAVIAASVAAPALGQGGPGGPPPAPVRVANAEIAMLAPTVGVPGTVVSRDDARLAAEVPGNLVSIAEVGETVAAGDVVAKIEDRYLLQQVLESEGQAASRESRIAFLQREVERLQRLAAQNNAARSQLDQTEVDLDVARSDLKVARAQLAQIRITVSRTEIRAPFAGRITQRFVNPGEHVTAGSDVVRLVSTDRIEVIARAPLNSASYISEGDTIDVKSDRRNGTGAIRTIVPFGDARSHMFEVRIDVPAADWIIGESVRVTMPTAAPRETLAVPRDALVFRTDGAAVFRVNGENKAERIAVETGSGDGELIAVISDDLQPGDQVVIRGAERLRPGQAVAIDGAMAGGSPPGSAAGS